MKSESHQGQVKISQIIIHDFRLYRRDRSRLPIGSRSGMLLFSRGLRRSRVIHFGRSSSAASSSKLPCAHLDEAERISSASSKRLTEIAIVKFEALRAARGLACRRMQSLSKRGTGRFSLQCASRASEHRAENNDDEYHFVNT